MSLSPAQLESISKQVFRQYPDVKGSRPSVQKQAVASEAKNGVPAANGKTRYVVTYKGSGRAPDGRTIQRVVRATTDENGRIIKMSTSK
jgi:hypothetical protein